MAGENHTTTDHAEIRAWADARGGLPAAVQGTGDGNDPGILRIEFPAARRSHEDALEPISWDEWLRAFDENGLSFVYQETTADGRQSRFNKLVDRSTVRA